MKALLFSSNVKCGGCIEKVTPYLNAVAGEGNWKVETGTPDKRITVLGEEISSAAVVEAIQKAGFVASLLPV
ncbi:copper chaperone [Filimonas zeae]|uniref:HMA domain-containing protein n=1 Tax=Filimonas zeae TaxID=1737353 RepID=A0A917J2K5_9BACT|nr:heavy-metal-associated domain-containing protein [Filimonas zeae]MDR6341617.1 copper chaperone [Filimonas zeae]GGH74987.1 hypothetical protein GCM10011379_38110 [Filimonas zeae]